MGMKIFEVLITLLTKVLGLAKTASGPPMAIYVVYLYTNDNISVAQSTPGNEIRANP